MTTSISKKEAVNMIFRIKMKLKDNIYNTAGKKKHRWLCYKIGVNQFNSILKQELEKAIR